MTIQEALVVSNRSVSARDAEIFLQHALGRERSWLHSHPDHSLSPTELAQYQSYLSQREANQPVAYIIGQREFYGRPFKTDQRALIPRPETEAIIDKVLDWAPGFLREHIAASNKPCPLRILDLGTGSGNIAVTLGLELAKRHLFSQVVATDISAEALALAQENWQTLRQETATSFAALHFAQADLFDHSLVASRQPYHLIVANLPYVPLEWKTNPEAQAEVVFQEPDLALFGGEDGLDLYRRFFTQATEFLTKDGKILLEFGEGQTEKITQLAKRAFPQRTITVHQDYAGLDRILEL